MYRHTADTGSPKSQRKSHAARARPFGGFIIAAANSDSEASTSTPTEACPGRQTEYSPAESRNPQSLPADQPTKAEMTEDERLAKFCAEYDPSDGADYSWLVDRAKEGYKEVDDAFNAIDTKAASVLNHFGSGTGIAAVLTVAGVATANISPLVALFSVIPFLAAVVSMLFAVAARRPRNVPPSPPAFHCHEFIVWRKASAKPDSKAEELVKVALYDSAALWEEARHNAAKSLSDKGRDLKAATWCKAAAIGLLLFPLSAAVVEKFATKKEEPKPTEVHLVDQRAK